MKHWIRRAATAMALTLVAAATAQAQTDLWLHVRVDEANGAKVNVNLPLALIEKVIPMIPEKHMRDGRIVIEDTEWSLSDLRELWSEVIGSPDMTFVTVEEDDEKVRVWKEGDFLLVNVQEAAGEGNVDVRIPASVIDALLSGDGDELNLSAALRALAEHGGGELVTVVDRDDRVRVWVDGDAESTR